MATSARHIDRQETVCIKKQWSRIVYWQYPTETVTQYQPQRQYYLTLKFLHKTQSYLPKGKSNHEKKDYDDTSLLKNEMIFWKLVLKLENFYIKCMSIRSSRFSGQSRLQAGLYANSSVKYPLTFNRGSWGTKILEIKFAQKTKSSSLVSSPQKWTIISWEQWNV